MSETQKTAEEITAYEDFKSGTLNEALDHAAIGRFDYTDPKEDKLVQEMIATKAQEKEQPA